MAERTTKGAAGPGKGISIGSYGEGKLPYPPDAARTNRIQSRAKIGTAIQQRPGQKKPDVLGGVSANKALQRAAGKRLQVVNSEDRAATQIRRK